MIFMSSNLSRYCINSLNIIKISFGKYNLCDKAQYAKSMIISIAVVFACSVETSSIFLRSYAISVQYAVNTTRVCSRYFYVYFIIY